MTAVGKMLVFLNLVFSLAVGAFAVLSFTADTHWRKGYDELSKKYQVVDANAKVYKTNSDRWSKERTDLNETLARVAGKELQVKGPDDVDRAARQATRVLEERRDTIEKLNRLLDDSRRDLVEERKKVSKYETVTSASQKDVERRQVDVEKMRSILDAETKKNNELVKDMNDLRDRAVAAEIQAKSFKDINSRLENQLQDMARDVARMRATIGSAGTAGVARTGVNPPPDNVEGLVRRAEAGLVSITIGSDAGLSRGHTMEVFRLGQNPKYIGRIRLVDVAPTTAVGQVVGRLSASIQVGDRVASRIVGGQ
jgi:uncharacterized protein YukE